MEGFKKGPWSKEEDAILLDWVAVNGPHNWSCIQSKGRLMRTGKSCRLRWVNKLRPGLKKGRKFSPAEEEMVVKLQGEIGNKWAHIAQFFPGRTDNDVKNFWSTRKKRLARNKRDPLSFKSGNETGMHGPELVVHPDLVHIYENPKDDQHQDKTFTFNHIMSPPYMNKFFDATSATPALTVPTSNLPQTKSSSTPFDNVMPHQQCLNGASGTLPISYLPNIIETEPSSAPFRCVVPHQQCLNATSATPILALPASNPPNTKSGPTAAPSNNVMPYQHSVNGTSAIPAIVPTADVPSIKSAPSSEPFNNLMPPIESPSWDRLFETELIFLEPKCCFLGCCRVCRVPPAFDDLTDDVLDSFDGPESSH
ncbi:Myb family transcription factor family protein [Rhynchospora pubera]|uniref:Myb family transcription factor family protein n=1 Tax=Rhynchospora pubera TaxID=906938 RepID=A0AAV8H9Z1_9POAL|nr:Myb family transcription factor family protein [Rhynchospora pubera]